MSYFSTHNHSHYSNLRLLDSINRPKEMIQYANEIGLKGIVLSDHEVLSGHVKFIQAFKELKSDKLNDGTENPNPLPDDFKIGLGNEIYWCMEDSLEELKGNLSNRNPDTKFYHFLLIATNPKGHFQLRQLSSIAWKNMFTWTGMERVPTFKSDLKRIIKQGDVIGTTACAGGYLGQLILKIHNSADESEKTLYKNKLKQFIADCVDIFGKDYFYLEVQPSNNPEQVIINKAILQLSKQTGLRYTIATDGHYLTKDDRHSHKVYLQSRNSEREVDDFYDATYIMSEDEIKEYLIGHMTEQEIQDGFDSTMIIYNQMEEYDLYHKTIIPVPELPEFDFEHILSQGYDTYEYIKNFAYSPHKVDQYFLKLIQEGLIEKIVKRGADKEYFHVCLDRINTELREIWLISEKLDERVSGYYVLTSDVVSLMWSEGDSIVGVARGSGAGYFVNFLTSISQVNPIQYDLPHYRHLTAERPELPDIDIDTEQAKRSKILQAMKDRYGHNKVLNIATFSTEGSRSALLSAARGLGIDVDEVSYLTSLIPVHRGFTWSLSDSYYGNEKLDRKPVKELINAVRKYEGLETVSLKIEDLVKARSVHASGIYIFSQDYTHQNALMRSSSGQETTQFDMSDSDYMGALKIDALTVQALDRIRMALDLLVELGFIQDEGKLKATYDKYIHPDVLEYEDKEMWAKVANNEVPDLFQFETPVGGQCVKKSKPTSVPQLSVANNLMRLMAEGGEQPIDKYVRHKANIQEWYDEMNSFNLTDEEVKVLEPHLKEVFGVGDSQEIMMELLMDEKICNFSIVDANYARKVVGKKIMKDIPKLQKMIFSSNVASDNLVRYVWETQIVPQLGYGFSNLHGTAYSLIALQEMNIAHKYPRIIWDASCLSVSASADEDNQDNKSTNYGKVAAAIGKLKSHNVKVSLPEINTAGFGFTVDLEGNRIIFGLKGIVGINDEVVHTIISNRPYKSFDDFHERLYKTKLLQKGHVLKLIKAGSFNEFGSPIEIMKQFLVKEVDVKDKLNGQNMKRILSLGLLDEPELRIYRDYINFKDHISRSVHQTIAKPKDRIFKLDDFSKVFFENNFSSDSIEGEHNGKLLISEKKFKKEYDTKMKPLMDLITIDEFVRKFNQKQFLELWLENAKGSVEEWEMESVSFYSNKHQLEDVDNDRYGIVNFFDLPEEPEVANEGVSKKGRPFKTYKLHTIVGTVLDKNKNGSFITVLTPNGVIPVKLNSGSFSFYDKQISKVVNGKKEVIEKSWFTRSTLVMLTGFRRQDQFVLKKYFDSPQQHTVTKILEVRKDGSLALQSERAR